jgi:hypothetical protein
LPSDALSRCRTRPFVRLTRCYNRSVEIICAFARNIRSPQSRLDTRSRSGDKQQEEKVSNLSATALIFLAIGTPVGDANQNQ